MVDITNTGVTKALPGKELERNQQRNWETFLQVLSLRTQPTIINGPVCIEEDLGEGGTAFGNLYTGRHKIWVVEFRPEHRDALIENDNTLLEKDFEQVPVISGLTETARFMLPIFHPYGPIKNIDILY